MKKILFLVMILSFFGIDGNAQELRDTFKPEMISKLGSITDVPPGQFNQLCAILSATNWTIAEKDEDGSDNEMRIVASQNMADNYGDFTPTGNPHNVFKIYMVKDEKFRVNEVSIVFNDLTECKLFSRALLKAGYSNAKNVYTTTLTVEGKAINVEVTVDEKDYMPTATIKYSK